MLNEACTDLANLEVDAEMVLYRLARMGGHLASFYHLLHMEMSLMSIVEGSSSPSTWGHALVHLFEILECLERMDEHYSELFGHFTMKIDDLLYQSVDLRTSIGRALNDAFEPVSFTL